MESIRLNNVIRYKNKIHFLRPIFISILHFNKQFFRLMSKLNRLLLLFLLYDAPIRRELKQMPFWRSVRKEVEKDLKMENGKLKMENEKKVSLQPD